jgi:hypothetical protein
MANRDRQTIQEFRSRPDLQRNMRDSFLRMLAFYGLETIESNPPTVRRAPSFTERSGNWLTANNHNHLRVTRILKSMRTLGLETQATALSTVRKNLKTSPPSLSTRSDSGSRPCMGDDAGQNAIAAKNGCLLRQDAVRPSLLEPQINGHPLHFPLHSTASRNTIVCNLLKEWRARGGSNSRPSA